MLRKPKSYIYLLLLLLSSISFSCGGEPAPRQFVGVRTIGTSNDLFSEPFGIMVKDGEIYVSDGQRETIIIGQIDRQGETGHFKEKAFPGGTPSGMALGKDGHVLVVDASLHAVFRLDGSTNMIAGRLDGKPGLEDGPVAEARFHGPTGIAVGVNGKIFVADTYNDRIRLIENGVVSTTAGSSRGYADGIGESAQFDTPLGLAMWGERLLVADAGNRRIRVVEPDGRVWTLAGNGGGDLVDGFPLQASFVRPTAIAVAPDGAIYVADGNAIRVIGRRSFPYLETISNDRRGFRDGKALTAQFNRPSGLAFDEEGRLLVADSDNGLVRVFDFEQPQQTKAEPVRPKTFTAEEFRGLQPPRWPYDPPDAKRDIAGTLGEIRNDLVDENSQVWFHNGLDIAGGYGEIARFIRDEKVLNPMSAENFGTLRELLRMPTIGYIHIRLGRDKDDRTFGDSRFIFSNDTFGKLNGVRVPRGAKFSAGVPIGTLNPMNHVHLIAGPSGAEMNALAALTLPDVSDSIPPVIEKVTLADEGWNEIETQAGASRIKLTGRSRIVVRAFDRMDGNPERRKLGVFRLGYQLIGADGTPGATINWSITFDRNPPPKAVRTVYATGSRSGYTGETAFNYIVTNRLGGDSFGEGFFDVSAFEPGNYMVRVFAADFFGNQAFKDIQIEVIR